MRTSSVKCVTFRQLRLNVSSVVFVRSVRSLRIQRRSFYWNRLSRAWDIIINNSSSLRTAMICDGWKSVLFRLNLRRFWITKLSHNFSLGNSVMRITSHSIRIVLLSRYVNIYDTLAPMSESRNRHKKVLDVLSIWSKQYKAFHETWHWFDSLCYDPSISSLLAMDMVHQRMAWTDPQFFGQKVQVDKQSGKSIGRVSRQSPSLVSKCHWNRSTRGILQRIL